MVSSLRHISRSGSTMVELMAVLAIMGMGIAAMLSTIGSGIDYAHDTENNIKAINLAREGIEGVINIRDTNNLRFSSDVKNCWRVLDYNQTCIGGGGPPLLMTTGSYLLYPQNGLWYLSGTTASNFSTAWNTYKNTFKVGQDATGYFTQTGVTSTQVCNTYTLTGCLSIFTREIQISEADMDTVELGNDTIKIKSIVRWIEKRPREVILETTLTNWKRKF